MKNYLKELIKSKQVKKGDAMLHKVFDTINKYASPPKSYWEKQGFQMAKRPKTVEGTFKNPSKSELKFLKYLGN